MKILFGVPDRMHRELADLEIEGLKNLNLECDTIHYGPNSSKNGSINKIVNLLINAIRIDNVLKKTKYDFLFLNTTFDRNAIIRDVITLFILKPFKTKVFLKFHGSDLELLAKLNWLQKKLVIWLFENTNSIGVLNIEERNAFIKRGYPEEKLFVIKNPINPSLYIKDQNFKTRLGLSNQTFVFIFCARFLPFKGIMDVLEALTIIRTNSHSIHVVFIGDGIEMEKAQLFVKDNDLKSFVTFTGFIAEIETRYYYSNADALVFPSGHEGFPMVVFQSLAAGIPIITTRISASADYLKEPDNCLWVEYKNPKSIAYAMNRMLTDQNMRTQMSFNNKLLRQHFTTNKNALEYKHIFNELLAN